MRCRLTTFFSKAWSYTASSGPKHISHTCVACNSYSAPHSRQRSPTTLVTPLSLERGESKPPRKRRAWLEHRRCGGRLHRDLAIPAQVAVAHPDGDLRRYKRVPAHFDALSRPPAEDNTVD